MSKPRSAPRQKRVFDSVFGQREISQPTPHATPDIGFTAPGQRFGGPLVDISHGFPDPPLSNIRDEPQGSSQEESSYVKDKVRWDRSWHIVTHALLLPNFPKNWNLVVPLQPQQETLDGGFNHSLDNVLYPHSRLPFARDTEDIFEWHTQQVRSHFLHQVLPIILHLRETQGPDLLVRTSVKILETAHRQYLHGVAVIKEHMDAAAPGTSMPILLKFRRDLHAIISNSVMGPLLVALRTVLERLVYAVLGLPVAKTKGRNAAISPESTDSEETSQEMLALVESLRSVGLAGERFQLTFAEIMNNAMTEYVYRGCKGVWDSTSDETQNFGTVTSSGKETALPRTVHHTSPSRCVADLCEWIEDRYAKLAVQVLSVLESKTQVSWGDKEKYKEMGIGRLAELRINELFDIVKSWPHSGGALDDLRTAITTPQRRLHLTEAFSNTLNEKLLHPGASTLQILQTYISMIWSFHALDHSKVLLDRVAYPLQMYLCSREDTVRIIITGLLANPEDSPGKSSVDKLVELAHLLNNNFEKIEQRANDEDLDWHDMEWVPDPVDAGPGYKRSKSADIIGTLIGALGAQDVFIKEFQNIIGENLLRHDGTFEREVSIPIPFILASLIKCQIKVLELLKVRFGEAPLQACEVMLKDIQDSGRVNGIIRKNQKLNVTSDEAVVTTDKRVEGSARLREFASINAKILSRLFWPQLQDDSFLVPSEISALQKRYEEGFEHLKTSRKLTWLHALGQATVELELQDRTIFEEVHTWQATVIWAFQSDTEAAPQRSVEQLVEHLEMEEPLVRSALKFWVNKLVLHEVSPSTFAVLETLNQEDRARSNAQAAASSSAANENDGDDEANQLKKDNIESEKMQLYWQFIQSMLKNSSSQMPLAQIAMMLKMLITEGFPYSNEELREFLATKVADEELELVGGKYKLKK